MLLVVAFSAVMIGLLEIPLVCFVVASGWIIGADRTKGWSGRHGQRFAVIVLAVLDSLLVITGL